MIRRPPTSPLFPYPPLFRSGPPDLLYIDPSGKPTLLELQGERIADRHIMAAVTGPDGDLWIATTHGLYRLPGARPGHPERVTVPGAKLDGRYVSVLSADGRLWATSESGIAVLERGT